MVQSLRARSGLEEKLTELEEAIIHPSIPKHEHPFLHSLGETIRHTFGITEETPSGRLKQLFGSLQNIVEGAVKRKKIELAKMEREEPMVAPERRVLPPVRRVVPEVEAECKKVTVGSNEAFDIGDIEGIRIGEDVVITIPTGKHVYLLTKGMGTVGAKATKLHEVV